VGGQSLQGRVGKTQRGEDGRTSPGSLFKKLQSAGGGMRIPVKKERGGGGGKNTSHKKIRVDCRKKRE